MKIPPASGSGLKAPMVSPNEANSTFGADRVNEDQVYIEGTKSKACSKCFVTKEVNQFYKKGHRRDSCCVPCKLASKKDKRRQKNLKKERRLKTKVLDVSIFAITETHLEKTSASQERIGDAIHTYVLDLLFSFQKECKT